MTNRERMHELQAKLRELLFENERLKETVAALRSELPTDVRDVVMQRAREQQPAFQANDDHAENANNNARG
jgi:cell division protein FtsB